MSWNSKCDDPRCPGWAVFNENEIQRCDSCDRFADDPEALAHVLATAMISWAIYDTRFVGCDGVELVRASRSEDCETIAVFRGKQFVRVISADKVPRTFEEWLRCANYRMGGEES